jgi:hypothetical protein
MRDRQRRKELHARYEARFALVADLLRAWDPYQLLALGAPRDEIDSEIQRVVARWDELRSAPDAARVLAEVFSAAFAPGDFAIERCAEIGERLWAAKREGEGSA